MSRKTAVGIDLDTTYPCVGVCPRIQMEMNTIWSWYVQSYAGRLAVVLYVGVLVGFITMSINQIMKIIAATNISSDYFMGEELNAALGFKKALQKFVWDTMKYIRFVTEFKGNWTTKLPQKRAIYPATWRAGCRRRPSRRTRRMQARARRLQCARQLQGAKTVFAKTLDSFVETIRLMSRKARNKFIHALNGNTVETKGREAAARKATTNVNKKWITFLAEMIDHDKKKALTILASGKTNLRVPMDEIKVAKTAENQKTILDKYHAAG